MTATDSLDGVSLPSTKRLVFLSSLGGTLEFFDFVVFAFFAPTLGDIFLPPGIPERSAAFQMICLFAAGYLVRPIGGVILAHFGDMLGRRSVFTFSIISMALSTGAIAILPTYETAGLAAPLLLIALRLMQGAAIGGEVPGAWTFVSEHSRSQRVGIACGIVCMGLTFGILAGSLTGVAVTNLFDPPTIREYAWRIPFFIGGVFGLIAVYLRSWLHETPVFAQMRDRMLLIPRLPLSVVLSNHLEGVLTCIAATWIISACIVVTTLLNTSFVHEEFGFTLQQAYTATSVATLCLGLGCVAAGYMADRFDIARFLVVAGVIFAIVTYWYFSDRPESVLLLYLKAGLMGCCVGVAGAMPSVMVKSFPAAVRYTGVSFSYNLGYAIFGGMTPFVVSGLFGADGKAYANYLVFIGALICLTGAYLAVRKPHSTRGFDRALQL